MNTLMLMQVSENVIRKSAEMAVRDPHGVIITLVSVSVVFAALIILYYAYTIISKAVNIKFSLKDIFKGTCKTKKAKEQGTQETEVAAAIALALDQELNGETYAAIGMALHQYLNDTVHDNESYIITIRRKN